MKQSSLSNVIAIAILTLLSLLSTATLAHDMVPAPVQTASILFKNATIHTVSDGVKHNTDLLIQDGVINTIGTNLTAPGAVIIDVTNKHIYPGLIALDTSMGLIEVEMMRPSNDSYEIGLSNPQLEAIDAFNPDSEIIPTVRVNGITHAQVVPQGERLAGQSALVSLDSWTIEDAVVPSTLAFHLYWPRQDTLPEDEDKRKTTLEKYQSSLTQINRIFSDGYRYFLASNAEKIATPDIRWHAMLPLYQDKGQGKAQLFVHANGQKQIEEAVSLAKQYQFKLVIVGGYDAWRLGELLNEIGAKVIYTKTLSLPMRNDEPIELSFKIPALLKQAQIPFALGFSSDWNSRNLPLAAGQTVAYGLSKEEALKSITLDAANIIGIDKMGAIAPGYAANLVISTGDILDPMTTKIEQVYIDGRAVDLNNRQQQLYQKYLKR